MSVESQAEPQSVIGQSVVGIPSAKLGMWIFLAGEILIFSGFIITCVLFRLTYPEWYQFAENTNILIGSINTFVLLTGSLTIALAFKMADKGDVRTVSLFMLITIIAGLIFLGLKAVEYSGEIEHGFTPLSGPFWAFYFSLTGFHALHVLTGTIINTVVLIVITIRKKLSTPPSMVENAGLFFHFVDIVWLFLFPLFYLS
ncbi:MAG: heme-copper oxidase subunit III [Thermodesulfobacteriota bacterium]